MRVKKYRVTIDTVNKSYTSDWMESDSLMEAIKNQDNFSGAWKDNNPFSTDSCETFLDAMVTSFVTKTMGKIDATDFTIHRGGIDYRIAPEHVVAAYWEPQ